MMNEELKEYLAKGAAALRAGELSAAVDAYLTAVAVRNNLPDAWFNLAWAQRALRQFRPALTSYAQAIRYGVERPEEAHLNRAAILSDHLFQLDEAELELRQAIDINPYFIPAWLNLGHLHEDRGLADAARKAYMEALAIDARNGRAHARLAVIDISEGHPGQAITNLNRALDNVSDARGRADILFAMGTAHDARENYDEAYLAYEAANWLSRSVSPRRYDRIAQDRLVERLIAASPKRAASIAKSDRAAPIFVVGMFRSGSTLVEQILARHSKIVAGGELEFLPASTSSYGDQYPEILQELSTSDFERLRNLYWSDIQIDITPTSIITDKRCDNFMHIGLIKSIFPDAKIIHTHRYPLDNFVSLYATDFDHDVPYSYDFCDIAHYYLTYLRIMEYWKTLYPKDIHDINYDLLVASPRREIERAINFLGLNWENQLENSSYQSDVVQTASLWQVRKPLTLRSSGRWLHYAKHLTKARELLGLSESGVKIA